MIPIKKEGMEHAAHKHDDEKEHHDDADKKLHALGFDQEGEESIGPGVFGMSNMPFLYAMDFLDVLKKNHAAGSYKEMVRDLLTSKLLMLCTWIILWSFTFAFLMPPGYICRSL